MRLRIMCILLCALMWGQCIQEEEGPDPEVVATGIEIKISEFRERQMRNCRERALDRATVIADSLIAEMALRLKDTIARPERMPKPEKPVFAQPPDSLPPKPIIGRDGQQ